MGYEIEIVDDQIHISTEEEEEIILVEYLPREDEPRQPSTGRRELTIPRGQFTLEQQGKPGHGTSVVTYIWDGTQLKVRSENGVVTVLEREPLN